MKGTIDTKEYRTMKKHAGIARHRHRGRCRRHKHSSILYLSPVPGHFGTGLVPLIPVPDWLGILVHSGTGLTGCRTVRHSGIYKKTVVGGGERETQCTSKLQVVESDTPITSIDSWKCCYYCYDTEIPEYRNPGEKLVRHRHFFR